jgi:hypothetical protein
VLREAAWKHERNGRLPLKVLALLVMVEGQRCKLLGLNAVEGFDPNAPPPQSADRDAMVGLLQKNLSENELREFVRLTRKAHGLDGNGHVPVETTATRTEAPIVPEPVLSLPPSVSPTPSAFVRRPNEPTKSFTSVEKFCAEFKLSPSDPMLRSLMQDAERAWLTWHSSTCRANPGSCPHLPL